MRERLPYSFASAVIKDNGVGVLGEADVEHVFFGEHCAGGFVNVHRYHSSFGGLDASVYASAVGKTYYFLFYLCFCLFLFCPEGWNGSEEKEFSVA